MVFTKLSANPRPKGKLFSNLPSFLLSQGIHFEEGNDKIQERLVLTPRDRSKIQLKGPTHESKENLREVRPLKAQEKTKARPFGQGGQRPREAAHVKPLAYMCGQAHARWGKPAHAGSSRKWGRVLTIPPPLLDMIKESWKAWRYSLKKIKKKSPKTKRERILNKEESTEKQTHSLRTPAHAREVHPHKDSYPRGVSLAFSSYVSCFFLFSFRWSHRQKGVFHESKDENSREDKCEN